MRDTNALFASVERNVKYGYWELADKYKKTLHAFYKNEYYQDAHSLYKKTDYSELDLQQKSDFYACKLYMVSKWVDSRKPSCMLDIGTGEGFALAYFKENKWDVTGIDLSIYGLSQHNPDMERYFIQGDFEKVVDNLRIEGRTYDFINADYVLEHIPDPEKFFRLVHGICKKGTILCVTVPNDFSLIQRLAYDMEMIDSPFWVTKESSEHFSYFSVESLSKLGEENGFRKVSVLSDWPIDFFLLHPNSNYQRESSIGHDCHVACARLENRLCEDSIDNAVKLFEALAEAGIGRKFSMFFRIKE